MAATDAADDTVMTCKDLWREVLVNSSAHGVPNVVKSQGFIKKSFWLLLILGFLAAVTYNIYLITSLYLSFPTHISLNINQGDQLPFPAVTICNMSPVRRSRWEEVTSAKKRKRRAAACASTGATCVSDCGGLSDGEYQYCGGCKDFISCNSGVTSLLTCPGSTNWKDDMKECNNSPATTCTQCEVYLTTAGYETSPVETSAAIYTTLPATTNRPSTEANNGAASTQSTTPETTAPETTAPETTAPETTASETTAPQSTASETTAPQSTAPETTAPETTAPETTAPQSTAPQSTAPQSTAPETTAPQTTAPQSTALSSTGPESSTAPESTAMESTSRFNTAPETTLIHITAPETAPLSTALVSTASVPETCSCCCEGRQISFTNSTPAVDLTDEQPKSPDIRKPLTESFAKSETLLEEIAAVAATGRKMVGTNLEELILDCQYQGSSCLDSYFVHISNPVYGNCYTFNSGWNSSLLTSTRTGPRQGLQMTLNIDQDEYVGDAGDTAGVRVHVHQGDTMPFPEDHGSTVEPGYHTYISLARSDISKLGKPYGDCREEGKTDDADAYQKTYPVNYSLQGCVKTCIQRATINRCQCASLSYPIENRTVHICSITNAIEEQCRWEVQLDYERGILPCNCREPCFTTWYETEMSSTIWPSDASQNTLFDELSPRMPHIFNDPEDPRKYSRNLMKLSVFYREFNQEVLEELPSYQIGKFASDLGGVLGLWFGVSAFTIFEFFEFFLDGLVYLAVLCRRARCRCRNTNHDKREGKTSSRPTRKAIYKTPSTAVLPSRLQIKATKKHKRSKNKNQRKPYYSDTKELPPLKNAPNSVQLLININDNTDDVRGLAVDLMPSSAPMGINLKLNSSLAAYRLPPSRHDKEDINIERGTSSQYHQLNGELFDIHRRYTSISEDSTPKLSLFPVHPTYGRKKYSKGSSAQSSWSRHTDTATSRPEYTTDGTDNASRYTADSRQSSNKDGTVHSASASNFSEITTLDKRKHLRSVKSENDLFSKLFSSRKPKNTATMTESVARLHIPSHPVTSEVSTPFSIFPSHRVPIYGRRKQEEDLYYAPPSANERTRDASSYSDHPGRLSRQTSKSSISSITLQESSLPNSSANLKTPRSENSGRLTLFSTHSVYGRKTSYEEQGQDVLESSTPERFTLFSSHSVFGRKPFSEASKQGSKSYIKDSSNEQIHDKSASKERQADNDSPPNTGRLTLLSTHPVFGRKTSQTPK